MIRDSIIPINMASAGVSIVREVYQYDHGLTIQLTNLENAIAPAAHFSIEGATKTVPVVFLNNKAKIPDFLLMQPREVRCYIYVEDSESGVTVKEVRIPIVSRPKPDGGEYTPEQIEGYDVLLQQLRDMLEETEEAQETIRKASEAADFILGIEMEVDQEDGCLYMTIPD